METRQQSLAGLAPSVAAQDALQKKLHISSFRCWILSTFITSKTYRSWCRNRCGFIQEYIPYQTQVIETSLAEFDRNAAANRQRIRDQAVASGAFGGGREGVELAEYQTGSDMTEQCYKQIYYNKVLKVQQQEDNKI